MSGDSIHNLKIAKDQPLNPSDLEYTQRLLEPFEDVVIERFNGSSSADVSSRKRPTLNVLIAVGLVLFINFPNIREKSGLNSYVLWLISALLLISILY
jgi:uncharacterized membrane protein YobD (UPF0266 family)